MSFADTLLTENLEPLRQRLLHHELWRRIEDGSLDVARLRLFALQDWWLVRDAYRLDALAVASVQDLEIQELLLRKLFPKVGGYKLLLTFGEAVGLSRADFDAVEPLSGCMALTNFFYWMLTYGTPAEKLAAVSASEDIFIQICQRIASALVQHYGLNEAEVEFFSAHDDIGEQVRPLDSLLLSYYNTPEERKRITRAVRLSHEYELLFYDTVLTTPLLSATK